jgi:hypothetical protein
LGAWELFTTTTTITLTLRYQAQARVLRILKIVLVIVLVLVIDSGIGGQALAAIFTSVFPSCHPPWSWSELDNENDDENENDLARLPLGQVGSFFTTTTTDTTTTATTVPLRRCLQNLFYGRHLIFFGQDRNAAAEGGQVLILGR